MRAYLIQCHSLVLDVIRSAPEYKDLAWTTHNKLLKGCVCAFSALRYVEMNPVFMFSRHKGGILHRNLVDVVHARVRPSHRVAECPLQRDLRSRSH